MAGVSSSSQDGGYRVFAGETEDSKEYKSWKVWVTNKPVTIADKVPAKARGAFVYTLLQEHLEPEEYQKEGGDLVLFKLLDQRFPAKEASDEMSEIMTEVFSLRAAEGESLKTWVSRATELFDRCQRKTNVSFPE